MPTPITPRFIETNLDAIATHEGRIVVILSEPGKLDPGARRVNKLMRGALLRFAESDAFSKMKEGDVADLAYPTGLAAEAVDVVHLPKSADVQDARKAGAGLEAQEAGMHPATNPQMPPTSNVSPTQRVTVSLVTFQRNRPSATSAPTDRTSEA